jgi:flavin-dependent dehydrogenase
VRRTVFHFAGGEVEIPVKSAAGVDALYAPRRTLLDRVLVDAAVEAGADVRFGVTVTDLTADGDGRVTGLVGRQADGRELGATGRFTVGADGVRSLVARRTGARTERTGRASALVYGYFADMAGDAYRWAFRDGGFAGVIPTDGTASVVFAGTTPDRFRSEVAGDLAGGFRRLLHEASPELAAALDGRGPSERLRGYAGIPGHVRQAHGPGWMLVGDAGYWKDPIGAHGLTQTMRDAELAATAIDEALTGATTEEAALGNYQRTRDELSAALFTVVDELAGLEWDADGVAGLLLSLSEAMRPEMAVLASLDAPAIAGDRSA